MRLVLITVLALSLVLMAACAMAGDYHTGTQLKCYQCHVMHETKSHVYSDDTGSHGDTWAPGTMTSGDHLLKYQDVNQLCFGCHDTGDSKDVFGAATGTTIDRQGGWFSLSTNTAAYTGSLATTYGHDLNNGMETPPGGTGSYTLNCASCHEPHGNAYYRNLKDLAGGGNSGITYSKGDSAGTNDPTTDVWELDANKYDVADISYNDPTPATNHYESFCVSCHTSVHSDTATGAGGAWLKHPTVGQTATYTTGTVSPLHTLGESPVAGQTGALVAGQVSCVTCHKAHGTDHPFGLIYDNRTTVALEDGTGTGSGQIRTTCKHCHDKGLTTTE